MATKTYLDKTGLTYLWRKIKSALSGKQDILAAGDGIQISSNTVSFDGGEETVSNTPDSSLFTLEDVLEGSPKELALYGDTHQDGEPSPDNPAAIKTAAREQAVAVIGKNLFNANAALQNKYIDGSGNWASNNYTYINQEYDLVGSSMLSFSMSQKEGSAYVRVGEYASDGTFIKRTLVSSPTSLTLGPLTAKVVFSVDHTSSNYFTNLQIEWGSNITSYEPYQEKNYTIDLGDIELCKLGGYQDYIYKSGRNWYLHKETFKQIPTALVNRLSTNTSGKWRYNFNLTQKSVACNSTSGNIAYSDKLTLDESAGTYNYASDKNSFTASATDCVILIQGIATTTKDGAEGWLAENPVTFYFPLATPVDTVITDEPLLTQLNAIELIAGNNTITVTSENLPASLSLTAYKNTVNGKLAASLARSADRTTQTTSWGTYHNR